MNLILLTEADFIDPTHVVLRDRRHQHLKKILKAAVGKSLCVGQMGGKMGEGIVTSMTETEIILTVKLDRPPPPPTPIHLILAMPRPLVFKRVLTHAITLGIKTITIIGSTRVEKSYFHTPLLHPTQLTTIVTEALEQAVDTIPPKIDLYPRWSQFFTDVIPELDPTSLKVVPHPQSPKSALDFQSPIANKHAVVAIGPEGGFWDEEIAQFDAAGFHRIHLGPRVLKVETAVCTAVAHVGAYCIRPSPVA